jgi:methyltransferase, FkbM family
MTVEQGKLVGGVWLPATETHLEDMMIRNPKGMRVIDGKATYQFKKLEAALGLCKRRGVAVDIGAHCGLWSMWLVKHFGQVHAFEPVPLHRELFWRNVKAENVALHAMALGETEDAITMQVPLETTGNAHIAIAGQHPGTHGVEHPERFYEVPNVPLRRLDSLGIVGVDFLKIDVEGVERAVIAGAEKTIRRDKPIIVIEQKGNDRAYGDAPNAAVKLLQSWGAKIEREISGDYLMRWDGCGCGDRREAIKRAVGLAP